MTLDLDTFLTIVYTIVDTVYQAQIAPAKPVRPGPCPELHDSEVLTLMLVAQWHPSRSERKVGRYAARHWRAYFAQGAPAPALPKPGQPSHPRPAWRLRRPRPAPGRAGHCRLAVGGPL